MNESEILSTEQKIIEAAKKVFLEKGFDGARMQHIADEAGINKASLHYYYRSKEKLFDTIFMEAFGNFLPKISTIMLSDAGFFEKIEAFVNHYIDTLIAHPHLPVFVLYELNRRPEKVIGILKSTGIKPGMLKLIIEKEISEGRMVNIEFKQLIVNIISLCIFPFIGKPIIQGFIFEGDVDAFTSFLEERKKSVALFIINSIKK